MPDVFSPPFRVRRATETDLRAICAVDVRSRQWGYRGLMPEEALARMTGAEREPRWREALSPGSTQRVWVAEREARALGFLAWGPARDAGLDTHTAELNSLYLEQEAAGAGLAPRLMDEALREMRLARYGRAVLWVLDNNGRARRFYERTGWQADGARKTISLWGPDLHAVRYAIAVP